MKPLNKAEREVLEFIRGFIEAKGYAPSIAEIALALGFKSKSRPHALLTTLQAKGYIERDGSLPRALRVLVTEEAC